MTLNLWDKTISITEDIIKNLLSSQFNIETKNIQTLDEGWDNSVFLINQKWVFRFPHRIQALVCMDNEIALLPYLKEQLPFAISSPTLIGHPTAIYPYAFSGYQLLPGRILSKAQIPLINNTYFAQTLGSWLKILHAVPILDEHISAVKGNHDWRYDVVGRTKNVQEVTEQYAIHFLNHGFDVKQLVERMSSFNGLEQYDHKAVYVHGDLYSKHILINEQGQPCGIIDWGDIHIGHPGVDLIVGVMTLTDPMLDIFLKAYGGIDEQTMKIALFRAYCHSISAFSYFVSIEQLSSLLWTKAALNNVIRFMDDIFSSQ